MRASRESKEKIALHSSGSATGWECLLLPLDKTYILIIMLMEMIIIINIGHLFDVFGLIGLLDRRTQGDQRHEER